MSQIFIFHKIIHLSKQKRTLFISYCKASVITLIPKLETVNSRKENYDGLQSKKQNRLENMHHLIRVLKQIRSASY